MNNTNSIDQKVNEIADDVLLKTRQDLTTYDLAILRSHLLAHEQATQELKEITKSINAVAEKVNPKHFNILSPNLGELNNVDLIKNLGWWKWAWTVQPALMAILFTLCIFGIVATPIVSYIHSTQEARNTDAYLGLRNSYDARLLNLKQKNRPVYTKYFIEETPYVDSLFNQLKRVNR